MIALEDLSLGARIVIGVMTGIFALMLMLVFSAEGQPPTLTRSPYDHRFVELDKQAIETAYVEQMKKLFNVWMTDFSDEPPKATKGAANARSAYTRAMLAIDRRERELHVPLPQPRP